MRTGIVVGARVKQAARQPHVRILGIDPGSRATGLGIIDATPQQARCVHHQTLRIPGKAFPERLKFIFTEVTRVVETYAPAEVAVESVFVSRNASSALKLGQARGAAICAVAALDLPVAEYAPRQIKQAVVGTGGADKSQMQHMVKLLLSLRDDLPEDSADALGVALCHAHSRESTRRLAAAGALS